ncbi:Carbohydrate kinase, FGGY [Stanieria cyanosphaera PCC 7437]|uniref:D-ribulose kinase n=1 Tax=Stanieria cyanosphaera (strain ATCC 29371 / PCC 7437) TaxID=111780 RepID=K9Y067_STAC7|nr:FGGY-family carbohydrate kinase [Stanieria cyanosphaera]AFZ37337.1 Carbohydrate kinase, FGGY [Stanieria cyanosphaera PCC 7437]
MNYYLGIDFGTSGARGIVIERDKTILLTVQYSLEHLSKNNLALSWQTALYSLIEQIPLEIRKQLQAIAINGTSATVLLCDAYGNPLDEPILYNDGRGVTVLETIKKLTNDNQIVVSATSSLAKLIWWSKQTVFTEAKYFLHQADWLAFLLHGRLGISDYHNALKLGYDVERLCYPDWLQNLPFSNLLPQILAPGTIIDSVTPNICDHRFSLSPNCLVCTGTTDSIAAFLASGASQPGEAVTSLGSTLVLKLLSTTKIDDASSGIYSHRLGSLWLTGGASNTGGAVLRHFFSDEELINLSQKIDSQQPSLLEYYPLLSQGDRFPINDPNLEPKLQPRPSNRVEFLHGLLESMARIEALGYQKLQQLGADKLTQVYTAGGGAKNLTWSKIRQRYLQVPVTSAINTEAAYGTALLALNLAV